MQTFYVFIGKDALYLYEKESKGYMRQYIAGNPEFRYRINHVKEDVKRLLNVLAEEYNLDNESELFFYLIENSDFVVTEAVCGALDGHISKKYSLNAVMPMVVEELEGDTRLLVKDFGINFDGTNYRLIDGELHKADYSLLGFTIQTDDFIQYID